MPIPAGSYQRVLIATDFSDCSALAVHAARKLGLLETTETTVLHAFDAPMQSPLLRASVTMEQLKTYIAEESERADGELKQFLQKVEFEPVHRKVQLIDLVAAQTIRKYARTHRMDLIVLGTHGRTGSAKFLLGSVAEDVLRYSEVDVLVVPPIAIA
jgi:nucleotide-binding universal stress UspA family protein